VGEVTRRLMELPGNITCIDTGYVRPQLAACYLLEEKGSAAIVETGTAHSVPTIMKVLALKEIPVEHVRYVMPTHVHLDHAGGAGRLMEVLPEAQLVLHPRAVRHMVDPSRLWEGTVQVYGEEIAQRLYGELVPVDAARILTAEDGFELDFNGRPLLFIDTPGHARHHYSIYDDRTRGFFTGDTFGMAYRELALPDKPYIMPTTTPVQFDPGAWYRTLDRYLAFDELSPAALKARHNPLVRVLGERLLSLAGAYALLDPAEEQAREVFMAGLGREVADDPAAWSTLPERAEEFLASPAGAAPATSTSAWAERVS